MGVNVEFDGGIHGNQTKPANRLGVIGNLLRPQYDLAAVFLPVCEEALYRSLGKGEGGGRDEIEFAGVEKIQENILENLGPDGQICEGAVDQAAKDGIGDGSHSRLQGEEILGQTAVFYFEFQEIDNVGCNLLGLCIIWSEKPPERKLAGLDDGNDL